MPISNNFSFLFKKADCFANKFCIQYNLPKNEPKLKNTIIVWHVVFNIQKRKNPVGVLDKLTTKIIISAEQVNNIWELMTSNIIAGNLLAQVEFLEALVLDCCEVENIKIRETNFEEFYDLVVGLIN